MPNNGLSSMYPTFPIAGSIALVLCMVPVPIHWKVGNLAIVSLALWTSIGLLICVIDTIIWHGSISNPYPIWGDIVQVYLAIVGTAIASCTLCVQYRLWTVARIKTVFITKREKRVQKYTTIFFCYGVPFIIGALHYVVQGHRYNLWEDLGPVAETYNTWLEFPLYYIWEPLICLVSGIFAMHTIALFLTRRKELDVVLNSGSININKNRYVRLACLAAAAVFIHLPLSSWLIIINAVVYPVYPWISWEDTHSNYHRIEYVTRFLVSLSRIDVIYPYVAWFSLVLCGINFFIFFGFGEEAERQYRSTYRGFLRLFGIHPSLDNKQPLTKRTWLDILLHRPGHPIHADPTASIPQFAVDAAIEQFRIGTGISDSNQQGQVDQVESIMGRTRGESSIVTENSMEAKDRKEEQLVDPLASTIAANVRPDLEAQTSVAVEQQRRQEILVRNPDLTEEVTF